MSSFFVLTSKVGPNCFCNTSGSHCHRDCLYIFVNCTFLGCIKKTHHRQSSLQMALRRLQVTANRQSSSGVQKEHSFSSTSSGSIFCRYPTGICLRFTIPIKVKIPAISNAYYSAMNQLLMHFMHF